MVRRYEEPIEVRAGEGVADLAHDMDDMDDMHDMHDMDDTDRVPHHSPSAFLWRGRLYVVRAVIGHWRERRAWWRDALDPDEDDSDTRRGVSAARELDCLEQEVWRVEASPGRLASIGVYDLGNDGGLGIDGPGRGWRLLRVAD